MTAQDLLDGQTKHRLTVEEFLLLDREGAFGDRRTELVAGDIYYMSPQYRPHGFAKDEMAYRLRRALEAMGSAVHVATEQSVNFDAHSQPMPDITLTNEPRGEGPIPGSSVLLVVEVSDNTLDFDLGVKADLYADTGVPEYWVVDLNEHRVLMHANPRPDSSGYDGQLDVPFGDVLRSATIDGLAVETTGLG